MKISNLIKYLENYKKHGYKNVGVIVNDEILDITGSYLEKENPFSIEECIILNTYPSTFGFLEIE